MSSRSAAHRLGVPPAPPSNSTIALHCCEGAPCRVDLLYVALELMYVCMSVCMYVNVYVNVYACMYVYMQMCMYLCKCVCIDANVYVNFCTRAATTPEPDAAPEPDRPKSGVRTYSTGPFFVFVRTCPPKSQNQPHFFHARSAPKFLILTSVWGGVYPCTKNFTPGAGIP